MVEGGSANTERWGNYRSCYHLTPAMPMQSVWKPRREHGGRGRGGEGGGGGV